MTNYIKMKTGYARPCWKCDGSGIFYRHVSSAISYAVVKDVCFPCNGTGAGNKIFASIEEMEKADARNEKARERKEAKRLEEWEAGREAREMEEAAREKARLEREAERATWTHLDAQIGDKVTVTGNVSVAMNVQTKFGESKLIVIETADKQAVKLFTTASWCWSIEADEAITVTGIVKAFDEYNGLAQTMLTRPKLGW